MFLSVLVFFSGGGTGQKWRLFTGERGHVISRCTFFISNDNFGASQVMVVKKAVNVDKSFRIMLYFFPFNPLKSRK